MALAVIAGACFVYILPELLPLAAFLPALCLCLLRFPARLLLAVVVLSAAWTTLLAHQHMQTRLSAAQDGTIHTVHGYVQGLPEAGSIRTKFQFVSDSAPYKLRLSWYDNAPELHSGDCLDLKVKLSAPHGSANPGGFDYEGWLWREGIGATGYVKAGHPCAADHESIIGTIREDAVNQIGAVLGDHPMRGIIEALTLGVTARITDEQWRVFRNTGTTHIVAISGWHIALVAGWLLFFARLLLLRLPWRLPVLPISAAVALAGAFAYALLAGLGLPTLRAVLMLGIGLVALLSARRISFSRVLALAAIIVVLWHPMAVLSAGFWLSFGAVAWIIYLVQMRPRSNLAFFVWLQLGICVGLAPVTLYMFNQASLVSPLVNAVVIPLAGVYVPLVLLSVAMTLAWPAIGGPCLKFCADLLAGFWPWLERIAEWPFAILQQPVPGLLAVGLALAGIVLLFMPRGLPGRWLGALFLLPLFIGWHPPRQAIPSGAYTLTVLDVGDGLSVVVQTSDHVLVYDAGPAYRTGFDAGSAIVVPYLRYARINRVDMLMISTMTGITSAVRRRLWSWCPSAGALVHVPIYRVMWGNVGSGTGVLFTVLHPVRPNPDLSDNNSSCVVRVSGPGGVTLLTGDIEANTEHVLVARLGDKLAADIVVVPHHGSDSSSSAAFVAATDPEYALVSTGWHNQWHFPNKIVVQRYRMHGATVVTTALDGALTARVWPHQPVHIDRWRVSHPDLWQIPDPQ